MYYSFNVYLLTYLQTGDGQEATLVRRGRELSMTTLNSRTLVYDQWVDLQCRLSWRRIVEAACHLMIIIIIGRPFVKRFALCCRTVVLSVCLSVTLVYCDQTVGWIKMKLGMEVGLGPGHILY